MTCTACGYVMNGFYASCPHCGHHHPTQAQPGHPGPGPQPPPHYPPHNHPPASPGPVLINNNLFVFLTIILVTLLVGSVSLVLLVRALFGKPPTNNVVQTQPTTKVLVRPGPAFSEVDAKMDSRLSQWTEAQKQAYWASVQGTQVNWSGEVVEVKLDGGGSITLKCNPNTYSSDVEVKLDGSQLNKLPLLSKGQRITIQGILHAHSVYGYDITQGSVPGL